MTLSQWLDTRLIAAFARWVAAAAPRTGRLLAGLFALYLVATLLSLVSLVPMLALIGIGRAGGQASSVATAVNGWLSGLGDAAVPLVLGLYFVIAATAVAIRYGMALQTSQLRETCLLSLREETYRSLLQTRWQAQARISDADCQRVLTEEAGRIALVIELAVAALLETALLAVLFAVTLWLSWQVTLAALGIGLVLMAILAPLRLRASAAGERLGVEITVFHRLTSASLASRKQIRVLRREADSHRDLADAAARVGTAHDRQRRAEAGTAAGLDLGMEAALVALVAGLVLWGNAADTTVFMLLYCAVRGFQILRAAHRAWAGFLANLPAFGRVQTLLAALKSNAETGREDTPASPQAIPGTAAGVVMHGVSVRYTGEDHAAISGIDLSILPGEMIALVGPSGSGKTSLADVCAGIMQPDNGYCRALVQGRPATMGYVSQESGLLPRSIRDNLLWSAPAASEAECWQALDLADAAFARALPEGLDTVIGATRARFSSGEQKRLALACALVRRPALLILDEATAQLDAESEGRILADLRAMRAHMTILLVTHRLASTQLCDRIVEMEHGRIVRTGDFAELAAVPGFFRRACEQQGLSVPAQSVNLGTMGPQFAPRARI